MFLKSMALAVSFIVLPVYAGGESGGGGDELEDRVNEIRADILNWIKVGGSSSLILPKDVSHDDYESLMTQILQPQKVVLGFIEKDSETNEELKVTVGGVAKTCRGFISKVSSRPHILCNISRFKETSDAGQYRLIHHEYAGLVRLEKNEGAASDYNISTQLTDYLRKETVLRLSVVKKIMNRHGFDPLQKLEEGRALYAKTLDFSREDLAHIEAFQVSANSVIDKLGKKDLGSAVNDVFMSCSDKLEAKLPNLVIQLQSARIMRDEKFKASLQSLEKSVSKYISAEECSLCDEVVRAETLRKYRESIYSQLEELKLEEYPSSSVESYMRFVLEDRCQFRKFFEIKHDKVTKDNLPNIMSTYDESLSVDSIISEEYDKALRFIGQNAPVKVLRNAKRFGYTSSRFDGKKVEMTMVYDWEFLTGYDNVIFPKIGNPIYLIQTALK